MSDTITEYTSEWAVPDLAVEFTDTLCRFWKKHRADYTVEPIPTEQLYMFLDSLTSVVVGTEEEDG